MFGQMSAFVNGNMFSGIFGDRMFVRLSEPEHGDLLREPGASVFEPMAGRPMRDYVTLPAEWRDQPDRIRDWMARSLTSTAALPAKAPKAKKKK
jgi:TfoX/Sxy family transcriptional regulator of competence genes